MTTDDALLKLADSTASAFESVLETIAPGAVDRGLTWAVAQGASPFQGAPLPGAACRVSFGDGVSGGTVFLLTTAGVRKLAALMMGHDPAGVEDAAGPLEELELSALSEVANRTLSAAAAAMGTLLGEHVEISAPETRALRNEAEADEAYEATPHATVASFTFAGEPCRLVQLVPNAFVVRMTRALADLAAEHAEGAAAAGGGLPAESLLGIGVRVSAELGRAQLAVGEVIGMRPGAVLELDRTTAEPIDVLVNGRAFARGRLILVEDEWAVQLDEIVGSAADEAA